MRNLPFWDIEKPLTKELKKKFGVKDTDFKRHYDKADEIILDFECFLKFSFYVNDKHIDISIIQSKISVKKDISTDETRINFQSFI